jgi:6-pyruvoyl-tetrahydropterin synthase
MIEIEFTKQELQDLHSFLLKNHLQVKQSVIDKIDHELITDEIFDLLEELENLNEEIYDDWQSMLWLDDEYNKAVKRNQKYWTRKTITELKSIISKLEAEQ